MDGVLYVRYVRICNGIARNEDFANFEEGMVS